MLQSKNNISDKNLILLFIKGDNKAFDLLIGRYSSKLFTYILHLVNNQELAEDLYQETLIKVLTKIKANKYVDSGKFGNWLLRISHNVVIDYFRKKNNYENSSLTDEQIYSSVKCKYDQNIEDKIIELQTVKQLNKIVHFLPNPQKEVVILRFYQNLSFKEIAEKTGVSINTSLGRMRYALMNIRKLADEKQLLIS